MYTLERSRTLDAAAALADASDDGEPADAYPDEAAPANAHAREGQPEPHRAPAPTAPTTAAPDATAPKSTARPLVLNFAHPYTPGGDVLLGARRQEEDPFRRTTLGASLTSPEAAQFYRANRAMGKKMFSNAAVVSPCVEVFRNACGSYRSTPFTIAVLSMTAPYAADLGSLNHAALFQILKARVLGMLGIAVEREHRSLVLGSWGCGAPGSDPRLVARAFAEAFSELEEATRRADGGPARFPFDHVCFAVPDPTEDQRVFRAFEKQLKKLLKVTFKGWRARFSTGGQLSPRAPPSDAKPS